MAVVESAIMKIASRCNINCTYCYMYNLADKTYKMQPNVMHSSTIHHIFSNVERYLKTTDIAEFHFSLHGGEPLLAGIEKIESIVQHRDHVQESTGKKVSLSIQTNSLLLDKEWIDFFHLNDIGVGISIDGPKEYHDRFRLTHNGTGTHDVVEKKITWLLSSHKGREVFNGVLCVLHPEMDGRKLIDYFCQLGVSVDFILPDQNYEYGSNDYPPPQTEPTYGKVLAYAYMAWRKIDNPKFHVRKFEQIIGAFFGVAPSLDSLGTGSITVFTIETSGEIEPVDSLKVCGYGFTKTKTFVQDIESFAEVNKIPLIKFGLEKRDHLPTKCTKCSFKNNCGGGYLPHRFSNGNFNRESVYCNDMIHLCSTILNDLKFEIELARERITANP